MARSVRSDALARAPGSDAVAQAVGAPGIEAALAALLREIKLLLLKRTDASGRASEVACAETQRVVRLLRGYGYDERKAVGLAKQYAGLERFDLALREDLTRRASDAHFVRRRLRTALVDKQRRTDAVRDLVLPTISGGPLAKCLSTPELVAFCCVSRKILATAYAAAVDRFLVCIVESKSEQVVCRSAIVGRSEMLFEALRPEMPRLPQWADRRIIELWMSGFGRVDVKSQPTVVGGRPETKDAHIAYAVRWFNATTGCSATEGEYACSNTVELFRWPSAPHADLKRQRQKQSVRLARSTLLALMKHYRLQMPGAAQVAHTTARADRAPASTDTFALAAAPLLVQATLRPAQRSVPSSDGGVIRALSAIALRLGQRSSQTPSRRGPPPPPPPPRPAVQPKQNIRRPAIHRRRPIMVIQQPRHQPRHARKHK